MIDSCNLPKIKNAHMHVHLYSSRTVGESWRGWFTNSSFFARHKDAIVETVEFDESDPLWNEFIDIVTRQIVAKEKTRAAEREARERAEYEELKKKYGGGA